MELSRAANRGRRALLVAVAGAASAGLLASLGLLVPLGRGRDSTPGGGPSGGVLGTATTFVHNFDMNGEYVRHLFDKSNVRVWDENPMYKTRYWAPLRANMGGHVIYRYDFPFRVARATFYANLILTNENDDGGVSISADGKAYTDVFLGHHGPPLAPIDVSQILRGSQEAYVRANLWAAKASEIACSAQFLRTHTDPRAGVAEWQAPNVYDFRAWGA